MMHTKSFYLAGLLCIVPIISFTLFADPSADSEIAESAPLEEELSAQSASLLDTPRIIKEMVVHGNKATAKNAILSYSPYKIGEVFDPLKTRTLIKNLYFGLGRFRNITLKGEEIGTDGIRLHIIVEEKQILKDILLEGNKAISDADIQKKVTLDMPAIDPEQLPVLARSIQQLYAERGYAQADIASSLQVDSDGAATVIFTINEGSRSLVKRIEFEGNNFASSKELRNTVLTREDWILGFLDSSGVFIPDRLEADKHMIEQFYQNAGFMRAKVTEVKIDRNPQTNNITLTFVIEEGERYQIGSVKVSGNDLLSEDYLLARIPLRTGMWYSRKRVADAIKILESIWGSYGYLFAHVDPSIEPNTDTKTVDISFFSDIGNKIYLNRLSILGNKKTRDKVIRRRIALEEGELISQDLMDVSKMSVESLGYFEQRDGVNWKIRRIDSDSADLDLIVNESKTGQFNFQLGYGGAGSTLNNPATGINFKLNAADRNLFGSGTDVNFEASFAKEDQSFVLHVAQPWLMDKPIAGMLDIYHRRPTYVDFRHIDGAINERITGGALTAGFITRPSLSILSDVQVLTSLGVDNIQYAKPPKVSFVVRVPNQEIAVTQLQTILNKEFSGGTFAWLANVIEQNKVNHPIHPSRGAKWRVAAKVAVPTFDKDISFYKLTLDANWFTPLIGERDLVFRLHGFAGFALPFGGRSIPYSELFHIGGPGSVRGFLFGQIGPRFLGDPIGAQKALFLNAELIFPITPDFSFKGVVFYDGGAGFDAPFTNCIGPCNSIIGNSFDYRHAVGFGLRIYNPMPVKIDWGFKIDPRKDRRNPDRSESTYEVHFGMSYDW